MRFIVLVTMMLFAGIPFSRAQIVLKTSKDSSAVKKDSVKVSVINPHGKQPVPYEGKSMRSDSVQQALKFNLFQATRGEYALYYEYRLSNAFSVEGGAGVTYTDYVYELFANDGRFLFKQQEGGSVKFLSGFGGHALLRWYPSRYETAITGFYLAPEFSYRNWKMDYYVNTGLIREPHRVQRSWTDFKLQAGFQTADPYENVFWEWFVSAGVRINEEDIVTKVSSGVEFSHFKYPMPVVGAGLKIGLTL